MPGTQLNNAAKSVTLVVAVLKLSTLQFSSLNGLMHLKWCLAATVETEVCCLVLAYFSFVYIGPFTLRFELINVVKRARPRMQTHSSVSLSREAVQDRVQDRSGGGATTR